MSTQKRRVIYMDDAEWQAAKGRAEISGMSVSLYIRTVVGAFPGISEAAQEMARDVFERHPDPTREPVDPLLAGKWAPQFRPAPKPGRK